MKIAVLLLSFLTISTVSARGYKGSVSFTNYEKKEHRLNINDFTSVARKCLNSYWSSHIEFYEDNCKSYRGKKVCLSKYYGSRKYSKKKNSFRSDGEPLTYLPGALAAADFPRSYSKKMKSTSCVGMTLKCLEKAFKATNQNHVWEKVKRFTQKNGVGGTALQHALRELGWKVLYWNPAKKESIVSDMKKWDIQEKKWASKGYHAYRYNNVMKRNKYWYNTIDDKSTLVGFGAAIPNYLYDIPFWVGTANTGYHVFPGTGKQVVEAHSTQKITSIHNIQTSPFSPFMNGGAPRWSAHQKYRSGMIAVPPGY